MDIRDVIKTAAEAGDLADLADLGWRIARDLEEQCTVIVDGDYVTEAVKQLDGAEGWTTGELADALAEIIMADQSEEDEMADKGPVIVTLSCEAREGTQTVEIDRAEWDAMTPAQRAQDLNERAVDFVNNQGGYGWWIDDPEDSAAAAAEEGVGETVPDPLRELAEWLVSLDCHPLMINRPTPDDMRAIVRRAREALGST